MRLVAVALICVGPAVLLAQTPPKLSRTEVVVVADLSDRIDPKKHPGEIGRDTAVVRMIADEFAGIVRRNRFLFSRDRLRMFFVGGTNAPAEARVDVAAMNTAHRVVVRELPDSLARFRAEAARPYKQGGDIGADLWSWFRDHGRNVLRSEDADRAVHTRIILLTDGYLEFARSVAREPGTAMCMSQIRGSRNWELAYQQCRLKSPGVHLTDTKVLILELAPVAPERNTQERAILERYWSDWFRGMGAEDVEFMSSSDPLPSVQDAVRAFLAR